jgi:hypothetical protein
MLTLTAPDGSAVRIDAMRVVRARRTISGERGGENKMRKPELIGKKFSWSLSRSMRSQPSSKPTYRHLPA